MPASLGDPVVDAGLFANTGGVLLNWCTGDNSATPWELRELVGFVGEMWIPVLCVSFLGAAVSGVSHRSISLELSESSSDSDLHRFFFFAGMSLGPSLIWTPLFLSEFSLCGVLSPRSDCVNSGSTAFLDVSTTADCPSLSDEEVLGISVSLDGTGGDCAVDRFATGCSETGPLAFRFPRSRPASEGLLSIESDIFCSSLLDVPLQKTMQKNTVRESLLCMLTKIFYINDNPFPSCAVAFGIWCHNLMANINRCSLKRCFWNIYSEVPWGKQFEQQRKDM